ncbi:MAG: hypothetical protein WA964_00375 [Ilumatobacter sp.]|uniref:sunset domain-containing protein n=1 Tax=Ilumatobacter sp. TaxID=1967498 RepID=UPI003C7084CB
MGWLTTALRRSLWLVLISAAGGAVWAWRRDTADASAPAPAEWPPLSTPPAPAATTSGDSAASSDSAASGDSAASENSAASVVNALVDAPEARSADRSTGGWADPLEDGSCPVSHPVKANDNSGIFHVPGGRFYDRTKPERCYSDADAAVADGYRRAKN